MLNKYIKKTFLPIALITAMNPILAVRMALLKTGNKAILNLNKLSARKFSILTRSSFLNNSKAIQQSLLLNQYNPAQSLLKKNIKYYSSSNNYEKLVKDLINSKEFKDLIQNPQLIKDLINSQAFKNLIQDPQFQKDLIENTKIQEILEDLIMLDPKIQELINDMEESSMESDANLNKILLVTATALLLCVYISVSK